MKDNNRTKKAFSKTGLILMLSSVVCLILVLAVGVPSGFFSDGGKSGDLDDENTPEIKNVIEGETPLLIFDKRNCAKDMIKAFDEGRIVKVEILYDQNGANMPVVSEDEKVIREAYKALKNIVVTGPTGESITDCYHRISFTTDEGENCNYSFEGKNILVYRGPDSKQGESQNYEVKGTEEIWNIYKSLAGKELR